MDGELLPRSGLERTLRRRKSVASSAQEEPPEEMPGVSIDKW